MTRLSLAVLASATLVAAGLTGVATSDAAPSDLGTALSRALTAEGVDPRQTGALAVDVRTGAIVFARNARRALRPASVEKL